MKHLQENNETYLNHMLFAGKIGLTLIFRGLIFILHAIFPICEIPRRWNLSSTSNDLHQWKKYTIKRIDNQN